MGESVVVDEFSDRVTLVVVLESFTEICAQDGCWSKLNALAAFDQHGMPRVSAHNLTVNC